MRGLSFIIMLLVPAFIALGHDIYLFVVNIAQPKGFTVDLLVQEFKFSTLGYIWTTYEPESFKTAVASLDKETWAMITTLLTFPAFFVGLAFAGTLSLFFGLLGVVFGVGPLKIESGTVFYATGGKKETSFRAGQGSQKINYKRK